MIEVLFGLWLFCCALYVYFSRDLQPVDEVKKEKQNKDKDTSTLVENTKENTLLNATNILAEKTKELENNCKLLKEKIEFENISEGNITVEQQQQKKLPFQPKENDNKFFYDHVTKRAYSQRWIHSLIPYTKGNHFWLIERKDYGLIKKSVRNAIEIVRNFNEDKVTIRYWYKNSIDGVEVHFHCFEKLVEINRYNKGKKLEIKSEEEQDQLLKYAEDLYNFFRSSSSYVKNLRIEDQFSEYESHENDSSSEEK